MAIPFLNNISLNNNEIQNVKLHNTGSIPSPAAGHIYFDTDDNIAKYYNGSVWIDLVANTNDFLTGLSFNTADGVLTATVSNQSDVTVDLDGRYALASDIPTNIVETVTTTDGTYINLTPNTAVDGDVTVTADLSAIDGTAEVGERYLTKNNTWAEVAAIPGTYDFNVSDGTNSTTIASGDTVTFSATANETTVVESNGTITIGLPDNVTIAGNLTVIGTTITNNVETVSTSNGVIFEGNAADSNEGLLLAGTLTDDRTYTLPDKTGTIALIGDLPTVNDATLTVQGNNGLTGSGAFTANDADDITITLSHADTSTQGSVNNSGRTYIQDITLDTYGHITGITSATETVTDTNTQLATAAALIDVSAMGVNTTASFTHGLTSKNLIVQMYDVTTGEVVFADIDHTSNNAISIIFASTPTNDIRVVVVDAKNGVTDSTVTYS